jgi:membrane-associated phospholipid phosphatase
VTIEEIIINTRTPEFTSFFKIFPLFVSDLFYMGVLSLGYWLSRNQRVFWQLGFLMPASIIIVAILNGIFMHDRPNISMHLVHIVDKSSGFPSGDVLVATVFWGMLSCCFNSKILRLLSLIMILCIMLSRVYLGVHNIYQVFAGLAFGLVIVFCVKSRAGEVLFDKWQKGEMASYWATCAALVIGYIATSSEMQQLTIAIGGILIGYGAGLRYVRQYIAMKRSYTDICLAALGVTLLYMINRTLPKIQFTEVSWIDAVIFTKYMAISLVISLLIPMISLRLHKNRG